MTASLKAEAACVFITAELATRAPKKSDTLREKHALQELAARLNDGPEEILPRFVDLAMEITGGISAGLSLLDDHALPPVFRWQYLRGRLAAFNGATTPRNFSPCGVTLDRRAPVLVRHPERFYGWIADAGIVVPEVLLVPVYLGGTEPLGTLWVVSDQEGYLDGGDARAMTELGAFVGIALKMSRAEQRLQQALDEKDLLIREMSHRVKNSLAVVQSLLTMQARASHYPEVTRQLEESVGRVQIFSALHQHLYQINSTSRVDIASYLQTLLHDQRRAFAIPAQGRDIVLDAQPLGWPASRAPNLGLIVVELVTNALKYGEGTVTVTLRQQDGEVFLMVEDEGGNLPEAFDPYQSEGLGMHLVTGLLRGKKGRLVVDRSRSHTCFVATFRPVPDEM